MILQSSFIIFDHLLPGGLLALVEAFIDAEEAEDASVIAFAGVSYDLYDDGVFKGVAVG